MFYIYNKREETTAIRTDVTGAAVYMLGRDLNDHIMFVQVRKANADVLKFNTVAINPVSADYRDILRACQDAMFDALKIKED